MKSDSSSQESATHSLCLTRNQQAVLDALHQQADALSAQELYRLLRERQAIGLATVLSGIRNSNSHFEINRALTPILAGKI